MTKKIALYAKNQLHKLIEKFVKKSAQLLMKNDVRWNCILVQTCFTSMTHAPIANKAPTNN